MRKESKAHGLQRRVEGPFLTGEDRLLVVEDVTTTGGSTIKALDALAEEGRTVVGVLTVLDRRAGGAEAIEQHAGVPLSPRSSRSTRSTPTSSPVAPTGRPAPLCGVWVVGGRIGVRLSGQLVPRASVRGWVVGGPFARAVGLGQLGGRLGEVAADGHHPQDGELRDRDDAQRGGGDRVGARRQLAQRERDAGNAERRQREQ